MATKCSKCGAEVAEDWPVCRSCFEPVRREGLLARLKRIFSRGHARSGSVTMNITENQVIKIRDPLTGNLHEYHSIEDVPAEFREQIRKLREQTLAGGETGRITVRDSSGNVRTYSSIEELPPDIRQLYDKARRQ